MIPGDPAASRLLDRVTRIQKLAQILSSDSLIGAESPGASEVLQRLEDEVRSLNESRWRPTP